MKLKKAARRRHFLHIHTFEGEHVPLYMENDALTSQPHHVTAPLRRKKTIRVEMMICRPCS
jgi:hypothetical protein